MPAASDRRDCTKNLRCSGWNNNTRGTPGGQGLCSTTRASPSHAQLQSKRRECMNQFTLGELHRLTLENTQMWAPEITGTTSVWPYSPSCRETCSLCPLQKAPFPLRPVYILSSTQLYTTPNSICRRETSFLYQAWASLPEINTLSMKVTRQSAILTNVFKWLTSGPPKLPTSRLTRGKRSSDWNPWLSSRRF